MKRIVETESAVPVNSMGGSSSTQGTGAVDTYDPMMFKSRKKLSGILKRPLPSLRATSLLGGANVRGRSHT